MLLQETKQDQREMSEVISQQKRFCGSISEARGASGGIVTLWDSNKWICSSTNTQQSWIRTALESRTGEQPIIVYNVYVPNQYREKEICWDTLIANMEMDRNANLIVAGDFNLVMHANEKQGGNFTSDPFRSRLEAIIQDHDLVDIRPKNRRYTWSNRRCSNILNVATSDHYPITLNLQLHCPLGPIPFKYSANWNRLPAAREVVYAAWTQHVEGSPTHIWETKLKKARQDLKNWAKSNYQEPEEHKNKIKQELEEVEQRIETQGLSQQNKEHEDKLYAQLRQTLREEETKWRLKSRQLWLQEGDKNTAYFHKQATVRKIRNTVSEIMDDERNSYNTQQSIKEAATKHFSKLLNEDKGAEDYSSMLQHMPIKVNQEMNSKLMKEVEEEEVREAIWSLHPDKAPRPDGFPISFYREYWTMIKKDLLKMIRWVMKKGKMGGFTNSTYVALIPKENRPSSFSRFRPIPLCNSAYKIISKILASRLKPHLPSMISENQGGFLPNRQISDSILLVQEAIHSSLSRKEKGFFLKLDLANAFDRVRHSYLFVVLQKMGFDPSFISMIAACITGPCISPLINGRSCSAFQSSRGLRQGCPLSPYLFILMAESFSQALDHNRRIGLITGIKIEQGAKNINHSQFADDTLLIGGASTTIARRFKKLLDQFMEYSGGKVNQAKSCIYGWNTANHTIHSIASIFGVPSKLTWTHFSYLGMPVSQGPLKADTWNEILDKTERKVQQWSTMWLNPAGRLVLLKSGITSLPLYRFSLYHAPAIFHQKMERILRHFL
eukprot:PITA_04529